MLNPLIDIFYNITKYSSVLCFLAVFSFVVIYPYTKRDLGFRKETISKLSTKDAKVMRSLVWGLYIGNFFQALFLIHILEKFEISFYSISTILYLLMVFTTLGTTIFTALKNPKIHLWCAVIYFCTLPFMIFYVGNEAINFQPIVYYASLCADFVFIFGLFLIFSIYRSKNAMAEIFGWSVLFAWSIYLTLI